MPNTNDKTASAYAPGAKDRIRETLSSDDVTEALVRAGYHLVGGKIELKIVKTFKKYSGCCQKTMNGRARDIQ